MSNPVWVTKDASGNINGVFANPQSFPVTQTTDTDPAVIAYLTPVPEIQPISRRQFYQQLAVQGIITQAQAQAAVQSGAIPSALQTLIAGLPTAEQFPATMMVLSEGTFDRQNPITTAIGTAFGMTSAQIDAFFTAAAAL